MVSTHVQDRVSSQTRIPTPKSPPLASFPLPDAGNMQENKTELLLSKCSWSQTYVDPLGVLLKCRLWISSSGSGPWWWISNTFLGDAAGLWTTVRLWRRWELPGQERGEAWELPLEMITPQLRWERLWWQRDVGSPAIPLDKLSIIKNKPSPPRKPKQTNKKNLFICFLKRNSVKWKNFRLNHYLWNWLPNVI